MEGLGRMDFPNIHTMARLLKVRKIHPLPIRTFGMRYDVCIKVQESMDLVAGARLRFMELLTKIQEVDRHAIIYPWLDMDWRSREPAIDNPEAILMILSNMKKYAYRMPIHQHGGLIYPQIFFGFMEPPDKIMENIEWWLRSMEQGMWKAQLQQAEETAGLGWLLFLADKSDKEALKSQIWVTMGVH